MSIPPEYHGREQTFLKHEVLRHYLERWGHKISSTARTAPRHLWFVDCFAGPWRSSNEDARDTSAAIALQTLNTVISQWSARPGISNLTASAIFIEANTSRSSDLQTFVDRHKGAIDADVLSGKFEQHVADVAARLRNDAALIFVDPTGWVGAGMQHIARLVQPRFRDVIINVMYEHINRFKADQREGLRTGLCDFFGVPDNASLAAMDERQLIGEYRSNLRTQATLEHTLDLAIPHPLRDRTYFHLVVGGHNKAIVDLFRSIEKRVIGTLAGEIRAEAKARNTGQLSLSLGSNTDIRYRCDHEQGLREAREQVLALTEAGSTLFGKLWPRILEECHITLADLKEVVNVLVSECRIQVVGMGPRERSVKDHHSITRTPGGN